MSKDETQVWDYDKNKRVSQPKVMKEFIEELIDVCHTYGLSISHEDKQGAFVIEDYKYNNSEWLRGAFKNFNENGKEE